MTEAFCVFSAKTPRTTQLLTSVYLQQLTLSKKALHHALYCNFHRTLDAELLYIYTNLLNSIFGCKKYTSNHGYFK